MSRFDPSVLAALLVAFMASLRPAPAAPLDLANPAALPRDAGGPAARLFRRMRVDGQAAATTDVRVLTSNPRAWWARWKLIEGARRRIDLTYFIIKDDAFGYSLLGLLAKKAREGVKIRLMLDSRGSRALSSVFLGRGYLKQLTRFPTVDIRVFNPLSKALLRLPRDLRHAVASNHDKILLVDDEWVLTGGRNIGHEYFAPRADDPAAYRDTDILLRGAAAAARARAAFGEEFEVLKNTDVAATDPGWSPKTYKLELARQVMQRFLESGTFYPPAKIGPKLRPLARELAAELAALPGLAGYGDFDPEVGAARVPAVLLDKSSFTHRYRNDITVNFIRLIDSARHSLVLQNPYVVLSDELKAALVRAYGRGVDIVLHTNSPDSADNLLPQAFFMRDWKEVLGRMPRLRVYASKRRPLHAKVAVIDDRVTMIGTYNLDPLSQVVNSELVAVVEDRDFAIARRREIAADAADSHRYRVEVLDDGRIRSVHGPEHHFKGFKKVLARLLGRWKWLERVI